MNNKISLYLIVVFFSLVLGSGQHAQAQSDSQELQYWFWQKGVEMNSEGEENSIQGSFSMDITKTNSDFQTLDYIFAFTDEGDYIRAGVVYQSTIKNNYLSPEHFFYSDDKLHYFTLQPYKPGIGNEISIFNENGWKISFHNTESEYFQEFDVGWASGEFISYGGVVFSGFSDNIDAISSCEHIGAIKDREGQKLVFGKNKEEWRTPEIVRSGYKINQQTISGNTLLYQIPPPEFVDITEGKDGYDITFDCPKNQSEQINSENVIDQIQDSQIPKWVKNAMKWYVEEKISEQEMINALQYLIEESIIKVR
ncbi:MAG: hypothetical protein ACO2YR_04025 [Nitrosopumilaceae archaeon]